MSQDVESPRWSSITKLVVALTFVGVFAGLLIQFRHIVGPLLMAFVLSYLLYPVVSTLCKHTRMGWRLTVTLIFVLIVLALLGALTWGGFTIVDQVNSLIGFLQKSIANLPDYLEQISAWRITIGPFEYSLEGFDLEALGSQLLGMIQPILSRLGTVVTGLASGAASTLGWLGFTLLISYFILSETEGSSSRLLSLDIPGYKYDVERIGRELGRIWNAFLRGQIILIALTIVVYTIVLGSLQVRFFFGLAVLAGLARFVPYVGPAVAWVVYFLVSIFQGHTVFGLSPFWYAALVVGIGLLLDNSIDSLITPRLMGNALQVHPAAVMVAALTAATLLGIIGVLLAAPVLASIKLVVAYAMRKMFDLDPWEHLDKELAESEGKLSLAYMDFGDMAKSLWNWLNQSVIIRIGNLLKKGKIK
ncbi:MAG: AI-2E family transporter [Chloroflexi bacterium]|nr:AI-2E family transporter [Chloroflexota bacterium]